MLREGVRADITRRYAAGHAIHGDGGGIRRTDLVRRTDLGCGVNCRVLHGNGAGDAGDISALDICAGTRHAADRLRRTS
ncbi:MAG: hypothetical protein M3517_00180 [Actinomycetota bacterium]|nr:hypothetical protein [Actinomycetota bacterium]